ncbi:conserved hypothetical protein [Leishmania braziliensis MHOM/BR/75/M2904]|uniref:Uncharacterized protein n=1 Tax=Leishmania braziliensis TaxID=5660 RepID=A4H4S2_LEIBR|nr:conserved hypothetical protein [Leishmania braziliensis MHOM/BR/75/M2904]CAJ2466704.1 unnamed protein product [Leishmania braziliensis]CAM37067.2 conserved hypothetical protein [Leishmania braziliensis MHOM/BR/75/M2904]
MLTRSHLHSVQPTRCLLLPCTYGRLSSCSFQLISSFPSVSPLYRWLPRWRARVRPACAAVFFSLLPWRNPDNRSLPSLPLPLLARLFPFLPSSLPSPSAARAHTLSLSLLHTLLALALCICCWRACVRVARAFSPRPTSLPLPPSRFGVSPLFISFRTSSLRHALEPRCARRIDRLMMSSPSPEKGSPGNSTAGGQHSSCGYHGAGYRSGVAENFHGRPAAHPFLRSLSSERSDSPSHDAGPSRGLYSGVGKDARLSGSASYSGRSMDVSASAENDGGRTGTDAVLADRRPAGTKCLRTGGSSAAMTRTMSDLRATHSGMVVPPIQGIPHPGGLPPETPAECVKVKCPRESHRQLTATKGAFSCTTSLAVLQRVQPLQPNTHQVEPAGWAPIEPSPMLTGIADDIDIVEEYAEQMQRRAAAALAGDRSPSIAFAKGASASTVRSPSVASRVFSDALWTPLEAMVMAETWKEDAPLGVVASAQAMQPAEDSDDAEVQSKDTHGFMAERRRLRQQQRWHCSEGTTALAPPDAFAPSTSTPTRSGNKGNTDSESDVEQSGGRLHTTALTQSARHKNSVESAASYRLSTTTHEFSSGRPQLPPPASRPDTTPSPSMMKGAGRTSRKPSTPMPRGFESFIEKGQQRRAEAERARLERTAEAAGELLIATSKQKHRNGDGSDAAPATAGQAAKPPRKMSRMPLPRVYESYVHMGQVRRAEANRKEAERCSDEIVNYTHHPLVNRPGAMPASFRGGASGRRRASYPKPRPAAAGGEDGAPAAGGPPMSVFERLSHKVERCDQRPRQLEERGAQSFQPHAPAPAAAVEDVGAQRRKTREVGRTVFEDAHLRARGDGHAATAASAAHASLKSKVPGRGAVFRRTHTVVFSTTGTRTAPTGYAAEEAIVPKKLQAEIEQHLAGMMRREEEHHAKWVKRLVAQAGEGVEGRHGHVALNPMTGEMAERARERYRLREEQAMQQREEKEAQAAAAATKKASQRVVSVRRALPSSRPVEGGEGAAHTARQETVLTPRATSAVEEKAGAAATPPRSATADHFYAHQLLAEKLKQRHLEELRLQRAEAELSEFTFHPRLNGASEKMAQRLTEPLQKDCTHDVHNRSASATTPWEGEVGSDRRARSVPQFAEFCGAHGHRPFVSSHSGILFQELNQASSLMHCHVPSPSEVLHPRPGEGGLDFSTEVAFNDDYSYSNTEGFACDMVDVEALEREATTLPCLPSGSMAEKLRNLKEMLREWKEIEREFSSMLEQPCKADSTE